MVPLSFGRGGYHPPVKVQRTDRRRAESSSPTENAESHIEYQGAAARVCREYEVLRGQSFSGVRSSTPDQDIAALRSGLLIFCQANAGRTPVLRTEGFYIPRVRQTSFLLTIHGRLSPAKSRPAGGCLRHTPAGVVFSMSRKENGGAFRRQSPQIMITPCIPFFHTFLWIPSKFLVEKHPSQNFVGKPRKLSTMGVEGQSLGISGFFPFFHKFFPYDFFFLNKYILFFFIKRFS